jgi:hypothetical protein
MRDDRSAAVDSRSILYSVSSLDDHLWLDVVWLLPFMLGVVTPPTISPMSAVAPLLLPFPPDDRAVRSIVVAQPLHLKGRYDPNQIAKLQLCLESGRELPLVQSQGQWSLQWSGWTTIGAHWLQMQGFDRSGGRVEQQFFYFSVCPDAATADAPIRLRLIQDSWFKATRQDSSQLPVAKKVLLTAGQTLEVFRYGRSASHWQLRLRDPIAPIGDWGYVDPLGVELWQGDTVVAAPITDVVARSVNDAQLQVRRTTYLKTQLADSHRLDASQKHQLIQGQVLPLSHYARCDDHWQVRLPTIAGFDRAWVAAADVQLLQGETPIVADPAGLTIEILQTTPLKARPLNPALLPLTEKTSLAPGEIIDLRSYAWAGDQQLKITRRSPATPIVGYLDTAHVQLRRGHRVLHPGREQLELNLPGSDRWRQPDRDWPILNILTIAAVLSHYGVIVPEAELLQWCFDHAGLGAQVDRDCLHALLAAYGVAVECRADWTTAQLRATLKQSVPIVVYGQFTPVGQAVLLLGWGQGGWRLYDPWGDATTGYRNLGGDRVDYPADYFTDMVGADGTIVAAAVRSLGLQSLGLQ